MGNNREYGTKSLELINRLKKAVLETAFGERDEIIYKLRYEYNFKFKELEKLTGLSRGQIHNILVNVASRISKPFEN